MTDQTERFPAVVPPKEADSTITAIMVPGQETSPAHVLATDLVKHPQNGPDHPGVREIIARLSGIAGLTYLGVTETRYETRTKVYIEVWLTNAD